MDSSYKKLLDEYNALTTELSSGGSVDIAKLGRRQSELLPTVEKIQRLEKLEEQLTDNNKLITDNDPEIRSMALDEGRRLEVEILNLKSGIEEDLLPRDPNDDKDAIIRNSRRSRRR